VTKFSVAEGVFVDLIFDIPSSNRQISLSPLIIMKISLSILTGITVSCLQLVVTLPVNSQANNRASVDSTVCLQTGRYVTFAQSPILGGNHGTSNSLPDILNNQRVHEHIFLCSNRRIVGNVGFNASSQRFSYSTTELNRGIDNQRGRLNFRPINDKRYDDNIIRNVLGSPLVNGNICRIQRDGTYLYLVNNCQGFTARVREQYWRTIFVGIWQAPFPDNQYRMRVTWNYSTNRYEGVLVRQGQTSQNVGFSIGEICWTAILEGVNGSSEQMTENQAWRTGSNGISTGFEWRIGQINLSSSTATTLVTTTATFRRVR